MKKRKNRFGSVSYDSDAQAYFTAASITSTTEKSAANTLILALKAAGLWTKMDRIYLRSPTSLAAALMCCKSLQSQTAVNSPTHSSNGIVFNGATQYARSDIGPSAAANVTSTSSTIAVYMNPGDAQFAAMAGSVTGSDNMYIQNGIGA